MQATRVWLEQLEAGLGTEAGTDPSVQLAYLAGVDVLLEAEDEEVRGALRRAVLLLAAGGDPQRALEVDGRAVTALADDLETPRRSAALEHGLRSLRDEAVGLPRVSEALERLRTEPPRAWRAFATAILAEELAE